MSKLPQSTSLLPNRLRAGFIVALAAVLASGAVYRVGADRLAVIQSGVTLPRGTLAAALPLQIQDWTGQEVPLDEKIVEKTDTDDHVKRLYRRSTPRQAASLYIAYGIRFRDLMPHRPEVCYTQQGWTVEKTESMQLTDVSGVPMPCQMLHFHRGALQQQETTVLYYYLINGKAHGDVSELRSRSARLEQDITYSAQVQISSSTSALSEGDDTSVVEFAIASAPIIRRVIEEEVAKAGLAIAWSREKGK